MELKSSKRSVFVWCRRSETNPRYPKYPQLPVYQCLGYVGSRGA